MPSHGSVRSRPAPAWRKKAVTLDSFALFGLCDENAYLTDSGSTLALTSVPLNISSGQQVDVLFGRRADGVRLRMTLPDDLPDDVVRPIELFRISFPEPSQASAEEASSSSRACEGPERVTSRFGPRICRAASTSPVGRGDRGGRRLGRSRRLPSLRRQGKPLPPDAGWPAVVARVGPVHEARPGIRQPVPGRP